MHYSIWKGLSFPSGGERGTPYLKVKPEGSQKSIEKIPSRPTGLYLRLGLIPSQTRIKKSDLELRINHNKQYKKRNGFSCRRERKKAGGDREENIKESHSIDSAHRFFFYFQFLSGRKRGLLVGLCPFSLFFRFTTGIRNLRIHPTCR